MGLYLQSEFYLIHKVWTLLVCPKKSPFLPHLYLNLLLLVIEFSFLWLFSLYFDLVGFFSRDPSVLHRVGHVLLKLNSVEPRRKRCLVFADDLFQVSKIPIHRTVHIISKVIESLSGCKLQHFLNILIVIEYLVSLLSYFFFLHLCCNAEKKEKKKTFMCVCAAVSCYVRLHNGTLLYTHSHDKRRSGNNSVVK